MKLDRRQLLAATGGALASVTLPDALFAQQSGRKILIIASNQDIPNFDPHIATGYSASMLLRNVYDSLVRVEGNPPKPVPHLATSWTVSTTVSSMSSSSIRRRNSMTARRSPPRTWTIPSRA